jgi:hypothetical protein
MLLLGWAPLFAELWCHGVSFETCAHRACYRKATRVCPARCHRQCTDMPEHSHEQLSGTVTIMRTSGKPETHWRAALAAKYVPNLCRNGFPSCGLSPSSSHGPSGPASIVGPLVGMAAAAGKRRGDRGLHCSPNVPRHIEVRMGEGPARLGPRRRPAPAIRKRPSTHVNAAASMRLGLTFSRCDMAPSIKAPAVRQQHERMRSRQVAA